MKKLTEEQEIWVCDVIGDWYLKWKSRMVVGGGQHRLGAAKEDLKGMICGCPTDEVILKIMTGGDDE